MRIVYIIICFFALFLLSGCSGSKPPNLTCINDSSKQAVLLYDYEYFGPQTVASSLIGSKKWPWVKQLDNPSQKFEISVVLYGGVDIEVVESVYPVDESKLQDFRYVHYKDAIEYFYFYSEFLIDMHKDAGGSHDVSKQYEILEKIKKIESQICEDDKTSNWVF